MELHAHLAKARARRAQLAEQRAAQTLYHFCWRSGGAFTLVGPAKAAAFLGWKQTTLTVRLSEGAGAVTVTRNHPETGEPDVLVMTRQLPPVAVKEPKRKGRPNKQVHDEHDNRLGTEFATSKTHAKRPKSG